VRLFVALEIPLEVRDEFAALINELRAADSSFSKNRARWGAAGESARHLKFIGHVDNGSSTGFELRLLKFASTTLLRCDSADWDFFPNAKRPAFSGPAWKLRQTWRACGRNRHAT